MNKKIVLISAFVIFLGLLSILFNRYTQPKIDQNIFVGVLESDIQKFDIEHFTHGITFFKNESDIWLVASNKTALEKKIELNDKNNFESITRDNLSNQDKTPKEANQKSVAQTLNLILNLRKVTLVSINPDKQSLFEINDDKASITLHLINNTHRKLLVGKTGPMPFSTFVRLADSTEVYLVGQNLGELFNHTILDWTDQNINPPTQ